MIIISSDEEQGVKDEQDSDSDFMSDVDQVFLTNRKIEPLTPSTQTNSRQMQPHDGMNSIGKQDSISSGFQPEVSKVLCL